MKQARRLSHRPPLTTQIKQWPLRIRWLAPLSLGHRWGMLGGLLLIILGLALPHTTQQPTAKSTRDTQQDAQGHWHQWQVGAGENLAQLFRNHQLPVQDSLALAEVEGDHKPLSQLQVGQQLKVRINTASVVTGLALEGSDGPILFTRQADGSFIRVQ